MQRAGHKAKRDGKGPMCQSIEIYDFKSVDSTQKKHDCFNKNKNNINLKYLICEKLDCVYLNKELKNEIIRR